MDQGLRRPQSRPRVRYLLEKGDVEEFLHKLHVFYDRMLRFEPCANLKTGEELEELLRLHGVAPKVKL